MTGYDEEKAAAARATGARNWTRKDEARVIEWLTQQPSTQHAWANLDQLADELGRSIGALQTRIQQIAHDYRQFDASVDAIRTLSSKHTRSKKRGERKV